jgi:hypothetical protein
MYALISRMTYDPPKVVWVWKPWHWNFGKVIIGAPVERDLGLAWCFGIVEIQAWRATEPDEEEIPEELEVCVRVEPLVYVQLGRLDLTLNAQGFRIVKAKT